MLIRGGGPLARAPPRCGCASTPIHSLSVLAESWLPTHTRVSFATEGDSLGEQERAWELQGAGQEEPQEERRGPETAGEASSFRASPAPNRWEWDTRGGRGGRLPGGFGNLKLENAAQSGDPNSLLLQLEGNELIIAEPSTCYLL